MNKPMMPQGMLEATLLNQKLKTYRIAELLGMYDFGGGNYVAPLPLEANIGKPGMQIYIVAFEEETNG